MTFRNMKTKIITILLVFLVVILCLVGFLIGKTYMDKTSNESNVSEDVLLEEEEMLVKEEPDSVKVVETKDGKKYTWEGISPVYDRSLTEGKMAVYFIRSTATYGSVVQGDSTLIIAPDGTTMLIDMQSISNTAAVVTTLDTLGIDSLDYLVISHPHQDHIGGYGTLMRYIDVKQVFSNDYAYTSSTLYKGFMDMIEEKNIPLTYLYEGDSFTFGGIQVDVYNPPKGYIHTSTGNINNGSLALKLTYNESTFMFSGDLFEVSEEGLVEKYGSELQSDIHKLNHHGRSTSSGKVWIETIQPKLVISEGTSVYDSTVMGRCARVGATVLDTGLNKTVAVWTSGDGTYDVQVQYYEEWVEFANLPENEENGHFVLE